jgi:type VI secretion system secreted protein VgrG
MTDIRIESKRLPCEDLRIRRITGVEAISRLFSFELLVLSVDPEGFAPEDALGARIALVFEREGEEHRRVHGVVVQVDGPRFEESGLPAYVLRVAPRAQRMELVKADDVFVDTPVPQIVTSKLDILGLGADTEMRLAGKYPPRELVIQHDETDLAFVSRLAEHLGVSFFFDQAGDRDRLVFTDHAAGFIAASGVHRYDRRDAERGVFALEARRRVVPSYYAVRDYDYQKPLLDLTAQHEIEAQPGGIVEFGVHHHTPEEGRALAQVRAEEQESGRLVYVGQSDVLALASGAQARIEGYPAADPLDLLVIEVTHDASFPIGFAGDVDRPIYRNTFKAVPSAVAYRPPRVTPRPRISGLVAGVIDPGPAGAKTYAPLDEQGRYRVRFLFDNNPPGTRPASGPVRMLQGFVGENYGVHFPLKVGTEVLVGFVNGDPDRPVIVGAAPNPLKPSPVTSKNPAVNRIRTVSGITLDMVDEA